MEAVMEAARGEEQPSTSGAADFDSHGAKDRLLRKAEAVLAKRTDRILLVLERCTDNQNYLACLRTAEILGVQNVWIVLSPRGMKNEALVGGDGDEEPGPSGHHHDRPELSKKRGRIARCSSQWLDIRTFATTAECVAALHADSREIWATDLAQSAILLEGTNIPLPPRLAIVMGREADGVSQEMLQAAHRRVCLPMYGYNDSFNLSVATAMVLHHLFVCCPEARGDLTAERLRSLRLDWYGRLARTDAQRAEFLARVDDPPPPFVDVRRPDEHRTSWVPPKIARKEEQAASGLAEQKQTIRDQAENGGSA
ncbi:hypothetical protein HYH03_003519 [Edaphochlamys debaryana]|uniref:tRNA/rRNA methyltransferase SpoU type domain-containing protein n=1 Tax=Edaphochlamys debaryana TaxID=47281 RepID=A0A835Y9G9_9CHLO|nr:hypothetical protein HYH03_003519 [Edaphochlamys debaryana]|eukprot:KAG2498780.1 hypothetical protein HYH03_003519 [Edaphochlamys debaryana]